MKALTPIRIWNMGSKTGDDYTKDVDRAAERIEIIAEQILRYRLNPDLVEGLAQDISEYASTIRERTSEVQRLVTEAVEKRSSAERLCERAVAAYTQKRAEIADKIQQETVGAAFVPHGYFVYVLLGDNDVPIYVGKSANIMARVGQHMRDKGQFIRKVQLIRCSDEDAMDGVEMALIWQHKPEFNIVGC